MTTRYIIKNGTLYQAVPDKSPNGQQSADHLQADEKAALYAVMSRANIFVESNWSLQRMTAEFHKHGGRPHL